MILKLKNLINMKLLEKILYLYLNRYKIFKTKFISRKDNDNHEKIFGVYEKNATISIERYKKIEDFKNKFLRSFKLLEAPLIKMDMVDNDDKYIFIDIHYIIGDGISINIIKKEICNIYNDITVNGNSIIKEILDYSDYALYNEKRKSEEYGKYIEFFKERFKRLCSSRFT